uniref:Protein NLRC3 isoform X2 n=1 Tax=Rhizophora mucronata TaxID=61149 RepID=A0A2P2LDB8_RHIMU
MAFTSTLALYSHPKIVPRAAGPPRRHSQASDGYGACVGGGGLLSLPDTAATSGVGSGRRRRCLRLRSVVVKAAASGVQGRGRRVYRQSQGVSAFRNAPVGQIVSFVVPAGVFVAVTFGMDIVLVIDCCGC